MLVIIGRESALRSAHGRTHVTHKTHTMLIIPKSKE